VFQDESSSGKRTKSSIGFEGLKDGKLLAWVVVRDNDGVEAEPEEEVCCVDVDAVRDMSLCDLR
jgi:hypothetical protein